MVGGTLCIGLAFVVGIELGLVVAEHMISYIINIDGNGGISQYHSGLFDLWDRMFSYYLIMSQR